MSNDRISTGTWLIVASIAFAMLLSIFPMPNWFDAIRPQWVAVVILYWCLALPHRVGILTAWSAGLLHDVLLGTLLGQHALGFAIISFLALNIHRQVRVFPLWQQAVTVTILLALNQVLFSWVRGMTGYFYFTWSDWASVIATGFICPIMFSVLRVCRLQFRVR